MKKKLTPPEAKPVAEHIPDEDEGRRCVLCGGRADGSPCPGVPAEEEVEHDFDVGDGFLPASQEYSPDRDDVDDYFESFTHDPDKPSFNVLCPVCGGRPCLPECKLGPWTLEEVVALGNSLPPIIPEG